MAAETENLLPLLLQKQQKPFLSLLSSWKTLHSVHEAAVEPDLTAAEQAVQQVEQQLAAAEQQQVVAVQRPSLAVQEVEHSLLLL